jgi:small-conductance mechanosensitive channel
MAIVVDALLKLNQFIIAFVCIVCGLVIGLIVERVILRRLKSISKKTDWKTDEIILRSLGVMPILWTTVAGIYIAMTAIPISATLYGRIEKALLVIVIFTITVVLARMSTAFVNLYAQEKQNILPSASIFTKITKLIVFVIGILIIIQSLGISITPLLTALGVGGLAVSLALQDTLSNLFAGLQVIVSRQIKPGDYVKLDTGEEGYVTDITWRNTTIRALPNNMIVVPNSKLAATIITNYYLPNTEMAVLVQVGVSYGSNLEHVEHITIYVAREVMREVSGGIPEFEPFIRYHTFADFSINFTVILRGMEYVDQYLIKHEFIKRLHKRYQAEGIEIPFPIRTIHLKEGLALRG